jgi:hypothetical protein
MPFSNWAAAQYSNAALDARILQEALGATHLRHEAEKAMSPSTDVMLAQRRFEEQLRGETSIHRAVLSYQQNVERSVTQLWGHNDHLGVVASGAQLPADIAWRNHELYAQAIRATQFGLNASAWAEIRRPISGFIGRDHVTPWDNVNGLSHAMAQEEFTIRQLSRINEFDRRLHDVMLEPVHAAWSYHLRTSALANLSVLAQEWSKPLGLMAEVAASDVGASVTRLARYKSEPMVMTAAVTPEADNRRSFEIVVDDEIACGICGNAMVNLDARLNWIGPRRAVRQRLIFPACSTCFAREKKEPGFLSCALSELTRPKFAVIRGGGQGDRRSRGVLRLVWNGDERG